MSDYTFETPGPIELYVSLGSGRIQVRAGDVTTTQVQIEGQHAEAVEVTQHGRQIRVVAPKQRGLFSSSSDLEVTVALPSGSDLETKTGSADLAATGSFGQALVACGSGEVEIASCSGEVSITCGSGQVTLEQVGSDLRVKSGSGDVEVGAVGGSCAISTGSGDVRLGTVAGSTVFKTGSGDLVVREAGTETVLSSGSGDFAVQAPHGGVVRAKTASGDVEVGVPGGMPVWADVHSISGEIRRDLPSVGEPAEGQPYAEVRITTVSGDIRLRQL